MAKIRNFYSFEGCIPHFCPEKREIWHGALPRAKFHVYRGNVSPLRSEKPIFGPLSKNNTGMAAQRAGLPVISKSCRQRWLHSCSFDKVVRWYILKHTWSQLIYCLQQ